MNGAPATLPGLPTPVKGSGSDRIARDGGGAASNDTKSGPSFRDLLTKLEGRKAAGEGGFQESPLNLENFDESSLSAVRELLAKDETLLDRLRALSAVEGEDSEGEQSQFGVDDPAAVLQLMALLGVPEVLLPQHAEDSEAAEKQLLDLLSAADKGGVDEEADVLQMPSSEGDDGETLAPLNYGRPGVSRSAVPADEPVGISVRVSSRETHFPALAMPSQVPELEAPEAANLLARVTADANGRESVPARMAYAEVSEGGATIPGGDDAEQLQTRGSGFVPGDDAASGEGEDDGESGSDRQRRETSTVPIGAQAATQAAGKVSGGETAVSQIAREIVSDLAAERAAASRSVGTASVSTEASPGGGVLKVLEIKLEPETLGTITVKISLKDNVVSLDLSASQAQTALVIEKEREGLSRALKSAGYFVDGITTQTIDSVRGAAGPAVAQASGADGQASQSASAQSQSGMTGGEGGRNTPGSSAHDEENRVSPNGIVNENAGGGSQITNGGLYV
jgi:chemotaxis protein MotD